MLVEIIIFVLTYMSSEYHYFITNDVCEHADISWDAMVALMLTPDDRGGTASHKNL